MRSMRARKRKEKKKKGEGRKEKPIQIFSDVLTLIIRKTLLRLIVYVTLL